MTLGERYRDLSRRWPAVERWDRDKITDSHDRRPSRVVAVESPQHTLVWHCCDMQIPDCFYLCPICGRENYL